MNLHGEPSIFYSDDTLVRQPIRTGQMENNL
jgi:hypothetical protein